MSLPRKGAEFYGDHHPTLLTSRKNLQGDIPNRFEGDSTSEFMWVVVKIMAPFWIPIIIRPLIFRVPKRGP